MKKLGRFENLPEKNEIFLKIENVRKIRFSISNMIFNENRNFENFEIFENFRNFPKNLEFFDEFFKTTQLFHELLCEKMSHNHAMSMQSIAHK